MRIIPFGGSGHEAEVAGWLHQTWWHFDGWSLAETIDYCARARGPAAPVVWVATVGGRPIGTVALDLDDLFQRPELNPWLASLYVVPEARGGGIGAILVRYVETFAAAAGHERLWLFTPDKAGFYNRLGWRHEGPENWHGEAVTLMSRRIGGPSPLP